MIMGEHLCQFMNLSVMNVATNLKCCDQSVTIERIYNVRSVKAKRFKKYSRWFLQLSLRPRLPAKRLLPVFPEPNFSLAVRQQKTIIWVRLNASISNDSF